MNNAINLNYFSFYSNFLMYIDFIDDNIKDDIECARMIFERNGFKNWKGWETRCKSKKVTEPNPLLPDIKNCAY